MLSDEVERRLSLITDELDHAELKLFCVDIESLPDSGPLGWLAVYLVEIDNYSLEFVCQLVEGVATPCIINYIDGLGFSEDACDNYVQHTPCAVV